MAAPVERANTWSCLEDCGDAFECVLGTLAPSDVAACRLVSRSWRREVDLLLQHLAPTAGSQPGAIAAAFPHLTHLRLTAGATSPIGCEGSGASASSTPPSSSSSSSSSSGSGSGSSSALAGPVQLPPLGALLTLRRLRCVSLYGSPAAGGQLDCRALLPLAAVAPLASLELSGLRLRHTVALQQLAQLTQLRLACGGQLGGWKGSLPSLLAPLTRLARLHFSSAVPGPAAGAAAAAAAAAGEAEEDAAVAAALAVAAVSPPPHLPGPVSLLAGLGGLASLTRLELTCREAASDAACREIAALPHLAHLAIARCASFGRGAESITDAGLAALTRAPLACQLTSLTLTGHQGISDEGVRHISSCCRLQHLQLVIGAPGLSWLRPTEVTDAGVCALASLSSLTSLRLGGAISLGEAGCSALARHLRSLTSLQITECPSLADPALFKLAPLAPRLRRLVLSGCEGVTDIGLAAVLRGASRLTRLELAGCHRNITGIGLQLKSLPRLQHLDLAGCDAITDTEIEALLPAAHSLEHLDMRDCRVSDRACALLAAASPRLRWINLEHCSDVTGTGVHRLAHGLPLLSELRLFGSGVSQQAAAEVLRSVRGRRLRLGLRKECWWVQPGAGAGQAPAASVAAH